MRAFCSAGILAALSLLSSLSLAEDFKDAKLIDIAPYKQSNAPIIAPNNGYPVLISTDQNMITITVAINGISYSANFRQSRDFKSSTLVVGDTILARLEGENLILKKPNGKEVKAKVTRRARLEPH
jgi:uncharacterized membrane protein